MGRPMSDQFEITEEMLSSLSKAAIGPLRDGFKEWLRADAEEDFEIFSAGEGDDAIGSLFAAFLAGVTWAYKRMGNPSGEKLAVWTERRTWHRQTKRGPTVHIIRFAKMHWRVIHNQTFALSPVKIEGLGFDDCESVDEALEVADALAAKRGGWL